MTTPAPAVRIVTDSTADIPADLVRELQITVVPMSLEIAGRTYRDKVDIDGAEFYRLLEKTPGLPTTSQPPTGAFEAVYRDLTGGGADVVAIQLSSELSGTYNVSRLAAQSAEARPGAVHVINSRTVAMSLGWLVIFAARAAQSGQSQADIVALVEDMVPRTRLLAALDTLEWLQRGGRIGLASALLGNMLAVKPIVTVRDGIVAPLERVRTKARAVQRTAELAEAYGPLDALAVAHGGAPEEAEKLVELVAGFYPRDKIIVTHISAVIGVHAGPRAVGICCVVAPAAGG